MKNQRGFTLVEAVMVIAITAIVSGMVAIFIKMPVQSYADASERAELSEAADAALRRMARDLRLALPNSVRIMTTGSTTSIEFLLTKTGGRYQSAEDGLAGGSPLDFANGATSFTVIGAMPTGRQAITANDYVVVYNLGPNFAPADAYSGGNRATVTNVAGNTITLGSNPFSLQTPAMESPTSRFHVVTGTVGYLCVGGANGSGTLTRYYTANINANQAQLPAGVGNLIADNVTSCTFDYDNTANTRTSLVGLQLVLARGTQTGALSLRHQVHLDNTP